MKFFNREKEIKRLKGILSGEPNVIWFIYGPINSGKTALITEVCEELPEEYVVFYINFRGKQISRVEDLIRALFKTKKSKEMVSDEVKDVVKEFLKIGSGVIGKLLLKGIPIPESIFEVLFRSKDKVEDIYSFLEEYFVEIKNSGKKVVFVLDELQVIKEVVNTAGRPVLSSLFNFLVRLTKETHLCHCLCATSDCLFMEEIYKNAHLQGRAKGFLVDDLEKEEAFKLYEAFGFKEKELIWDYIGGKVGDMVLLLEEKKQGISEKEAVINLLEREVGRLEWIKYVKLPEIEDGKRLWRFLLKFKEKKEIKRQEVGEELKKVFFWVEENILFFEPVKGIIRPQGRLIWKAILEVT